MKANRKQRTAVSRFPRVQAAGKHIDLLAYIRDDAAGMLASGRSIHSEYYAAEMAAAEEKIAAILDRKWDTTPYKQIIFLQGESAEEALLILDRDGTPEAITHLAQWECDDEHSEWRDCSSAGTDDRRDTRPAGPGRQYVLSWNERIGYIVLELFSAP